MRKKRDYKKAMGWFIVIVMVMSVLGFVGTSFFTDQEFQEETEKYNGYPISFQYGLWDVNVLGETFSFQYFPTELENITIPIDIIPWLGKEKIYLAYVPDDRLATDPYIQFIGSALSRNGIIPQQACAVEEGCPDIPVIDCSSKEGFILSSGDQTMIASEDRCLLLQAADEIEMQKLVERVTYQILGVMV